MLFFIPITLILCGLFGTVYYTKESSLRVIIETTEEVHHIQLQFRTISESFNDIIGDLLFLAEQYQLKVLLNEKDPKAKGNLAEDYLIFLRRSEVYDQIRFINTEGMEVVRINYNDGNFHITPQDKLQNKQHRYYFQETFALNKGHVFISPLDLNIENGKVEKPYKPMIRFATPVFDRKGNKRGIIVLNFLGKTLLDSLRKAAKLALGEVSLVNPKSYWLLAPLPEDEWGFMIEGRENRTFANRYPEAWKTIKNQMSGQFYLEDGFFTFATIYPFSEIKKIGGLLSKTFQPGGKEYNEYYWKTISRIPSELFNRQQREIWIEYLNYLLASLFIFAAIIWFLVKQYTFRREAEKTAFQNASNYQSLFENMFEGYAYCRIINGSDDELPNFNFLEVNEVFVKMISKTRDEILGSKGAELFPELRRNNPEFFELCNNVAQKGTKEKNAFLFPSLDKWLNISVYSPKRGYFISVFEDITARKKSEKALEEQQEHLEQLVKERTKDLNIAHDRLKEAYKEQQKLNELKDEFLATTSHELRTPLASILGYSETMDECATDEKERKRFVKNIIEETERLGLTIQNMLDVSHISSGTLAFYFEEAELDKILKNSLHAVQQHLSVKKDLKALLPETGVRFFCDKARMMQMIINLLDNAIKHSPARGGSINVNVERQADHFVLAIENEGPKIPDDQLQMIFQKFHRVKETNLPINGTGLGLTIAKGIVEAHQGKIWAENTPKGVAFYVSIPFSQPSPQAKND